MSLKLSSSAGGTWGTIAGLITDQADLQAVLAAKASFNTPVDIAVSTTLTAASHANRVLRITGNSSPTLTFQTDALGGFGRKDAITITNVGTGTAVLVSGAGSAVLASDGTTFLTIGPGRTVNLICAYAANTATQIGGMLDGYYYVGPWASRPAGYSNSNLAWITDIGSGTDWRWDTVTSCWRPARIIELRAVLNTAIPAPLVTGEQSVAAWVIVLPPGVCRDGTRLDTWASWSKSGVTDVLNTVRIRVGSGMTVQTYWSVFGSATGIAASRQISIPIAGMRFTSDTSWVPEAQFSGATNTAIVQSTSTAGMGIFLHPTISQLGTTDTVSLEQHCVRLFPRGM